MFPPGFRGAVLFALGAGQPHSNLTPGGGLRLMPIRRLLVGTLPTISGSAPGRVISSLDDEQPALG